jgi:hypothetical protein
MSFNIDRKNVMLFTSFSFVFNFFHKKSQLKFTVSSMNESKYLPQVIANFSILIINISL